MRIMLGLYTIKLSKKKVQWRAGVIGTNLTGKGKTIQEAKLDAITKARKSVRDAYPEGVVELEI